MKNALAFRSAFSAFLRSRLGAAGVEFALLLPMAAFVLAVALESARLSIAYALIERAVEEGIHEATNSIVEQRQKRLLRRHLKNGVSAFLILLTSNSPLRARLL